MLESNYRLLESTKSLCDNCRVPLSGRASFDDKRDEVGSPDSMNLVSLESESGPSPLPPGPRTPEPTREVHVLGASQSMSLAAELAQVFNKNREFDMNEVVKDALEQNKSYETVCSQLLKVFHVWENRS